MNWEIAQMEKSELMKILDFDRKLDTLLDKGMLKKKDLHSRLTEAVNLLYYSLEKHIQDTGNINISSCSIFYTDHFRELRVIMKNLQQTSEKTRIEEVFRILESRGLSGKRTENGDLSYAFPGDSYSPEMIIRSLEVFDKKIGFVLIEGENLDYFTYAITDQFSNKVDTLIYAQNRMTLEELKNSSLTEIDRIFDSDLPVEVKFHHSLKLAVENTGAAAGFLSNLREGELKMLSSCTSFNKFPIVSEDFAMTTSLEAFEGARSGEHILVKEIELNYGSLLVIILKASSKPAEGVLLLQFEKLTPERKEVAMTFSGAIDSTLHIERLHGLILRNFIHTLGQIIDTFDTYTSGHSGRVADYAQALGKALNLTEIEMTKLRFASILHDIGKVGVDPGIIRKTARLSDEERKIVETHARHSGSILDGVFPFDLEDIHNLAMSHHEKEDGTGYPNRLKGNQIPLLSKIISVADIFDALTSDRPYHRGRTREQAYDILKSEAEKGKLSPMLVGRFASDEVWQNIKADFFGMKIQCYMDFYKKEMLPDLKAIEKDIKFNEKCLADLKKIEENYNNNIAVDSAFLEDSLLYPADKENLIQIEYRRDRSKYLGIIGETREKYERNLNLAKEKLEWERIFAENYWQPEIPSEIERLFTGFTGITPDMMSPLSAFSEVFGSGEDKDGTTLLQWVESKLNESAAAKKHNDDYAVILQELADAGRRLDQYFKNEKQN